MNLQQDFSYNKQEKLKSKKLLQKVFENKQSFTVFPIKFFFVLNNEQDNILKTGVGVSSKNFKKAVDRNRIKRLLREAYRTEKNPLINYLNSTEKKLAVFLLFADKALPDYILLKEKMHSGMLRLIKFLNEHSIKNS